MEFNYRNSFEDFVQLNKYLYNKRPMNIIYNISSFILYCIVIVWLAIENSSFGIPKTIVLFNSFMWGMAFGVVLVLRPYAIDKKLRKKIKKIQSKKVDLYDERRIALNNDRMILTNLKTLEEKDIARSDIGSVIRDKDYIYIYKYEGNELLGIVHSCYIPEDYYDDFCIWMNIRK
ncbi:MAG: hypothetical protein ACRC17_05440 [Culicoidibacterales bacterium]